MSILFKPNGTPAGDLDRLMLLNIWAHYVDDRIRLKKNKMIFAGLGKPTYLLNEDFVLSEMRYWQRLSLDISRINEKMAGEHLSEMDANEEIVLASTAIDYLLPAGDEYAKGIMAKALTKWYGVTQPIQPDELIFTVGGAAAIRMMFRVLHSLNPQGRVFTPSPYYSLYHNPAHHNHFYYIDLIKEPGLRLTANAVERDLTKAIHSSTRKSPISGILFCDPNNPMGYVVGRREWELIAEILKKTSSKIPIILDEAYAEMVFGGKHESLLTIAPELKQRLIIFRSATKGFSASGERIAVIACFNRKWREELINETVLSYAHAPKSLQIAYARAMQAFTRKKREKLSKFYQLQVEFVQEQLKKMDMHIPDPNYRVEGTFYVLANLSIFFGLDLPLNTKKALGHRGNITTDEEICYMLLFNEGIMVAPFSYFGGNPHLGFVRISCCGGIRQLNQLLTRLQKISDRTRRLS